MEKSVFEEGLNSRVNVSHGNITLTENEYAMLETIVNGGGLIVIQSILAKVAAQTMRQLETADKTDEMFRLQGQIRAFRWLQNFPGSLVAHHSRVRKEAKTKEIKEKDKNFRPSSKVVQ